jgi:hypothetical protein
MTTVRFKGWVCEVRQGRYDNGRTALTLVDAEDGQPVATATVNVPHEPLAADECFVKDYAENEGMLAALEAAGVVKATGRTVWTGRVQVPVCELLAR